MFGVAVELKLAERLVAGPRTAQELAAEVGAHAPSLRRLLRALGAMGVVAEDASGRYSITTFGEELRQERLGPAARFLHADHTWLAWLRLDHSIKTGERAFDQVYGMRSWASVAQRGHLVGSPVQASDTIGKFVSH